MILKASKNGTPSSLQDLKPDVVWMKSLSVKKNVSKLQTNLDLNKHEV